MDSNYKRVTRRHVAERAGVSPTIVSYVINNNRYVDREKRRRVIQAIQELSYQPNAIAKSLKSSKSYHIAFITDEIANEHFSRIVLEMEDYAYGKGYIISLCHSRNDEKYIHQMISRQFDGIVISTNILSEDLICKFPEVGIPTVLFGNRTFNIASPEIAFVNINIYGGAQKAIAYLIEKGHRKIAFLDNITNQNILRDEKDLRMRAYRDTLIQNDIEINTDHILSDIKDHHDAYRKCHHLFKAADRPTALFAHDDMLAVAAMSAINHLKLKIPEDVAVIGFDNSTISNFTVPPLTTVEIPRDQIGKTVLELLLKRIEGQNVQNVDLDTTLVIRDST